MCAHTHTHKHTQIASIFYVPLKIMHYFLFSAVSKVLSVFLYICFSSLCSFSSFTCTFITMLLSVCPCLQKGQKRTDIRPPGLGVTDVSLSIGILGTKFWSFGLPGHFLNHCTILQPFYTLWFGIMAFLNL